MRPRRDVLLSLDMYRKVPVDLLEGTQEGRLTSWFAILVLLVLFFKETHDFLSPRPVTDLSLDRTNDPKIQVNFNISMLDLRCDYATINVHSVLGNEQNITKNIQRIPLDEDGWRNVELKNIQHHNDAPEVLLWDPTVTQTLDELHAEGKEVVELDEETLFYAIEEKEYVFVKYYADWCSHCRVFAPSKSTMEPPNLTC